MLHEQKYFDCDTDTVHKKVTKIKIIIKLVNEMKCAKNKLNRYLKRTENKIINK